MNTTAPIEDRLTACAARSATGPKAAALLREAAGEIVRLKADLAALSVAKVVIRAAARPPAGD